MVCHCLIAYNCIIDYVRIMYVDKSTTDEYGQLEKMLINQLQAVLTEMPGTYVYVAIVCNMNSDNSQCSYCMYRHMYKAFWCIANHSRSTYFLVMEC